MLDGETLSRRIASARELRGIAQADLGLQMEEEGFGKHDAARIERQDAKAPPFSPGRRRALSAILGVPERWFTAPDPELFARPNGRDEDLEKRLEEIERATRMVNKDLAPLAGLDAARLERLVGLDVDQLEKLVAAAARKQRGSTPRKSTPKRRAP